MITPPHSQWSCMTWPEIASYIDSGGDAVLLPLGATEQHGPHLGTGMDSSLAESLCGEVSKTCGVPTLPTISYGCSIGHSHRWPGTLALSPEVFISVIVEIGAWLYHAGIRRVFMINCHVGNAAPMRCALDKLRCQFDGLMLAGLSTGTLTPEIEKQFSEDAIDWHANAAETSLMMATAPQMVRNELCTTADDPDRTTVCVFAHPVNRTSSNGVTGYPSKATPEAGENLYQQLVKELVSIVNQGLKENSPLPHDYFERISPANR